MRDLKINLLGVPVTLTSGMSVVSFDVASSDSIIQIGSNVNVATIVAAAKPIIEEMNAAEKVENLLDQIYTNKNGKLILKHAERSYCDRPVEGLSLSEFLKTIYKNEFIYFITPKELAKLELALPEIQAKEQRNNIVKRRRSDFDRKRDQIMLVLIERDGYKCQVTGSTEDLTIDHIVPLSKGGSDDIDNLRLVTRSVNSSKGSKPL